MAQVLEVGGVKYRPFDQLRALGERAGVAGANFKRFRHALSTAETQRHYTHDDLVNLRDAMKGVDFGA